MAVKTRKAFGCTITVIKNNVSFHTFTDWKLTITNNNYIGEPEVEQNYLDIPGRPGPLDYSEALTGKPVYKSRPLHMEMAAVRECMSWDAEISTIRNAIHGQKVKMTFDNDKSHYWQGRIYLKEYDREKTVGRFDLDVPVADAYKYELTSSQEPWLWDPFDFENDVIRYIGTLEITDSYILDIPKGDMPTVPVINVTAITSNTLTMKSNSNNKTYTLATGRNRFPDLFVNGASNVRLTFTGSGTVKVDYRGGSL